MTLSSSGGGSIDSTSIYIFFLGVEGVGGRGITVLQFLTIP